ncbi:CDP-glucose 4,6-dehydratase [Prochlorococcus sp. AH-736-A21]|nr:CDP-glucose 4,6-dehydratase [Prochlorococcus sp. AH-736-A21]
MNLESTFRGKKVLITGNTGFKGSWLTIWLLSLGAEIYGIALEPPTKPSIFNQSKLVNLINHHFIDIQDHFKVSNLIKDIRPDFIFHLAAQPLVKYSYDNPIETWKTNVNGTINVLNSLRLLDKKCISIFITSDKCYANSEWVWGYRENDMLGGDDPYSASKGAAEIAIKSYQKSFFKNGEILVASVRAGNVIGGGDWAQDRIVPDCIRAWSKNQTVEIRSGNSTRPWQHVLEPLSGYLKLAKELNTNPKLNGNPFNFGPNSNQNYTVIDVVKELSKKWESSSWKENQDKMTKIKESKLLKLNCDKALHLLNWSPTLNFKETIDFTIDWYYGFYKNNLFDVFETCTQQIKQYTNKSGEDIN